MVETIFDKRRDENPTTSGVRFVKVGKKFRSHLLSSEKESSKNVVTFALIVFG